MTVGKLFIGGARGWWIGVAGLAVIGAYGPAATGEMLRSPPSKADWDRMRNHEAEDIALLLGLRPEQRPALAAFLADRRPPVAPRPDTNPGDDFEANLRRMEADTAKRFENDKRQTANARTFFKMLDPRQRTAFEALMRLRNAPGRPGPGEFGPHRPSWGPNRGQPDGPPPGGVGPGEGKGPVR